MSIFDIKQQNLIDNMSYDEKEKFVQSGQFLREIMKAIPKSAEQIARWIGISNNTLKSFMEWKHSEKTKEAIDMYLLRQNLAISKYFSWSSLYNKDNW